MVTIPVTFLDGLTFILTLAPIFFDLYPGTTPFLGLQQLVKQQASIEYNST